MARVLRYYGVSERIPRRRGFHLWFPDFPDLEARAESLDEVEPAATRLVLEEVHSRRESGVALPEPHSKEHFHASQQYRSALLLPVDVDPETGRVEGPEARRKR